MKLHLGCGSRRIPGFVNIDCRPGPAVDDVQNARCLPPRKYPPGSVDLIYACHILEHFDHWTYEGVLRHWHRLLKPGGILRISVPDFEKTCAHYQEHHDIQALMGALHGRQDFPENIHLHSWDFQSLKSDLESVGFRDVRRYDWRQTEHAGIDDFSQAYLPYMDKEHGMLMSLNVEATR